MKSQEDDETQTRIASQRRDETHLGIGSDPRRIRRAGEKRGPITNETNTNPASEELNAALLRLGVDHYYTVQKTRIRMINRRIAIANIYEISPDLIGGPLSSAELIEKAEDMERRCVEKTAPNYAVYREFLAKIRGIGPLLSGQLIGLIRNVNRFEKVSHLWAYALGKVENGEVVRRRRGETISHNPELKRLCHNVAKSFIRQGRDSGSWYRLYYDQVKPQEVAKHAKNGCKRGKDCSAALHADLRAIRRVAEMFLSHLWEAWRELDGLPVTEPYAIAYLGHKNWIRWRDVVAYEEKSKARKPTDGTSVNPGTEELGLVVDNYLRLKKKRNTIAKTASASHD